MRTLIDLVITPNAQGTLFNYHEDFSKNFELNWLHGTWSVLITIQLMFHQLPKLQPS